MFRFIGKRLIFALITLWTLITLTFFMMRALPGDPFVGERAIPEATKLAMEAKYGLDKPVIVQYGMYLLNICKGDLGLSINSNRPVTKMIAETFPVSFDLGIRALIFAAVAGVLLGILAARKRGTLGDSSTMLIAIIGVSVPSFIIGALLQFALALGLNNLLGMIQPGLKLFPVEGWSTEMHKILPAFALGLGSMATISRLMRTSMLDVMGQDYMKTAKAKGLSEKATVWKHAVRNALMPVITVLGPIAAAVLTGAFVIETIFNIPGMGRYFVTSIQTQDYTVIAGTTLFYGGFLILANLIVDLTYGFIDPRVKLTGGKG